MIICQSECSIIGVSKKFIRVATTGCLQVPKDALINLASNEYFGAVRVDQLGARVITPRFLDSKDGAPPKMISFFAKRARGAMAGWMIRERITSIRALHEFDGLGYAYDADASRADAPVFTRSN